MHQVRRLGALLAGFGRRLRAVLSFPAAHRFWSTLEPSHRLFFSNIAIAVLIAAIVALFHQSHWLVRLENSAMDTMMELNKGLPRMSDAGSAKPLKFAYLDIDDESYLKWGEPYHVPRDKILDLIESAANANARLIVLDIDLSREGVDAEADRRLAAFLQAYGKHGTPPPLVLVRTFFSGDLSNRQWVQIRPSFLDKFEFSAFVHWGQPLFKATMWDGIVRHWHLVKFGCLAGRIVLVPSTQLIAAALMSDSNESFANRSIALNTVSTGSCTENGGAAVALTMPGAADSSEFLGPEAELSQRLIYSIPWKEPAPDLVIVPAHLITESTRKLSNDLVENRVVIIGASFAESRDIHRTPIGKMPGALIIANAIKSLTYFGQVRRPATFARWGEKLTLIFLAAWLFSRFTSLIAVAVAGVILIVALVPISFHFFKNGVWVDFAVPILAMVIHRGVAEMRSYNSDSQTIDGKHTR